MKISNRLTDEERAYLNNLITSGAGEIRDSKGNISDRATHELVLDRGFVVGARKIIRTSKK